MRRWYVLSLWLVATLAFGCSSAEGGSEQVSVSRDGSVVTLTSSAPGRADVNTQCFTNGPPAVCASSFEWEAQGIADMYLYGLVPAGAAYFQATPDVSAKLQADGTFLAVIAGAAQSPLQSVHWSFLASDGTILASGDGPNT